MSSSREHTSLRVWKALSTVLEEDEGFNDESAEMAVSTSTVLSLDGKPMSNSLDLTSTDISRMNRTSLKIEATTEKGEGNHQVDIEEREV